MAELFFQNIKQNDFQTMRRLSSHLKPFQDKNAPIIKQDGSQTRYGFNFRNPALNNIEKIDSLPKLKKAAWFSPGSLFQKRKKRCFLMVEYY
jgi:hypothetical protein